MPTTDSKSAISMDEARHRAGLNAFPDPPRDERIGGVGLEPEFFPIIRDGRGRPQGRLLLTQSGGYGVLEIVDELAASEVRFGRVFEAGGKPQTALDIYNRVVLLVPDSPAAEEAWRGIERIHLMARG